MLKVDSFRTGSILLFGLFFYDIWWVFGTKVVCDIHYFLGQIVEADARFIDGQCRNQPRPPHKDPLAKVDYILLEKWEHDARPR